MQINTATFEKIEKEEIPGLKFPDKEVLLDTEKIKERAAELNRALLLGNLEHTKIKIYFEDENTCRVVETTVWGVTDKRIILKQGVVIPIIRVHQIKI
jgi:hypothetical protein